MTQPIADVIAFQSSLDQALQHGGMHPEELVQCQQWWESVMDDFPIVYQLMIDDRLSLLSGQIQETALTITLNDTFGQLYVERADGQDVRIPRQSAQAFIDAIQLTTVPCTISPGPGAESVWQLAQQYAGWPMTPPSTSDPRHLTDSGATMAHPDTIQLLKHQLKIEHYEQGWHWETDEFCCEDFLPSRKAALSDFNQFCTSGELDQKLAQVSESSEDPTSDLFETIKGLEGNISLSQMVRIEQQVLSEGKGFLRYLELLNQALMPLVED